MTNLVKSLSEFDLPSFGNNSFSQNLAEAEKAISDLSKETRIFNRGNTQFTWRRFVLKHATPMRNIRQISAEIEEKKHALLEAKFGYLEKMAERDELLEAFETANGALRRSIALKIRRIEEEAMILVPPIEGAIKDVLTLTQIYHELAQKLNGYTERDFENMEVEYWIKRLFSQSLRDLREMGTISKGEQEAIEDMGINISMAKKDMDEYLNKEMKSKDVSIDGLEDFLNSCVKKYKATVLSGIEKRGMVSQLTEESLYNSLESDLKFTL